MQQGILKGMLRRHCKSGFLGAAAASLLLLLPCLGAAWHITWGLVKDSIFLCPQGF
jgi:hypothetical protein